MSNPNADEIAGALNAVKVIQSVISGVYVSTNVLHLIVLVRQWLACSSLLFKASVYFAETTWAFLRVLLSSLLLSLVFDCEVKSV